MDNGSLTQRELQAELDTLRSLRRRSISQPSDGIDPDLPPSPTTFSLSPPGSPTFTQRSPTLLPGGLSLPSPPSHHGAAVFPTSATASSTSAIRYDASSSVASSSGALPSKSRLSMAGSSTPTLFEQDEEDDDGDVALSAGSADLSDLFWLPARLHPEIAPQEFRNFIRDQTKPENLLRRSGSGLGRKKSMLSHQYMPRDGDGVALPGSSSSVGTDRIDKGKDPANMTRSPSRSYSFRRSTGLERLTLNDLQRLEQLARQAAEEGQTGQEGEAKLKHLVRRSLSLNPASLLDTSIPLQDLDTDDSQPFVHEADAPLIVPPPGSILRRSARTKIRKNSLVGDGNGHRFGPSRRVREDSPVSENGHVDDADITVDSRKASVSSQLSIDTTSDSHETDETTVNDAFPSSETFVAGEPVPLQYVSPTPPPRSVADSIGRMTLQDRDASFAVSTMRAGADVPTQQPVSPLSPSKSASSPASADGLEYERHTSVIYTRGHVDVRSAQDSRYAAPPLPSAAKAPSPASGNDGPVTRSRSRERAVEAIANRPSNPITPSGPKGSTAPTAPQSVAKPHRMPNVPPLSTQIPPAQSLSLPTPTSPPPKQKEKKSGWAKLGLGSRNHSKNDNADADDSASIHSTTSSHSTFGIKVEKSTKKSKKDTAGHAEPQKGSQTRHAEKDKEPVKEKSEASGGFFGGIFGGKRKIEQTDDNHGKKDGHQARTAMPTPPPTASGMLTPDGRYVNFYRLPIHIERAVYRLSHIKLANPRRPLFEQVLISNLMFWYLGVINKPTGPPQVSPQITNGGANTVPLQQRQHLESARGSERHANDHQGPSGAPVNSGPHRAETSTKRPPVVRQTTPPPESFPRQASRPAGQSDPYRGEDRPLPPVAQSPRQAPNPSISSVRPVSHPSESTFAMSDVTPLSPTSIPSRPVSSPNMPTKDYMAPLSPPADPIKLPSPVGESRFAGRGEVMPRPQRTVSIPPGLQQPMVVSESSKNTVDPRRFSEVSDIISSYADVDGRKGPNMVGRTRQAPPNVSIQTSDGPSRDAASSPPPTTSPDRRSPGQPVMFFKASEPVRSLSPSSARSASPQPLPI